MLALAAISLFVTGAEVAVTGLVLVGARQRCLRRGPARRRRALPVRPHRRPGALDRAARCRAWHRFASLGGAAATSTPGAARRSTAPSWRWSRSSVFWIVLAPLLLLWIVCRPVVAPARRLRAQRQRRHRPARHGRLALRLRRRDHGPLGAAQQPARAVAEGRGLSAGDLSPRRQPPKARARRRLYLQDRYARQHRDLRAAGDPAAHAARVRGRHPVPERARRARGDPRQGPRAGRGRGGERDGRRSTERRSAGGVSAPRPCASAAG